MERAERRSSSSPWERTRRASCVSWESVVRRGASGGRGLGRGGVANVDVVGGLVLDEDEEGVEGIVDGKESMLLMWYAVG